MISVSWAVRGYASVALINSNHTPPVESTLKRHGYYCRSRNGLNAPKARSCLACVRAKVRCDNKKPSCSRCAKKSVECRYPAKTSGMTDSKAWRETATHVGTSETSSSSNSVSPKDTSSDGDLSIDPALAPNGPDFADLANVDWEKMDLDLNTLLDPRAGMGTAQGAVFQSKSMVLQRTPSRDEITWDQYRLDFRKRSIPRQLPMYSLRSLFQRPNLEPGAQRISKLILHTLKSYPRMVLRNDTLPPYIHAKTVPLGEEGSLTEPLSNAVNLVRMISGGNRSGRKLFWKNVRLECERCCNEVCSTNIRKDEAMY